MFTTPVKIKCFLLSESQDTCNSVDQPTSWSDSETVALIDVWIENEVQEALRGSVHNIHVFTGIAEKLSNQGLVKTPEQCRWKIKNLTKDFRQCYERKKWVYFCLLTLALTFHPLCLIISSILFSSRCGTEKVDCKYYDKLEQVLGDEAFSMDADDEDDQDAGLWLWNPFIHYLSYFV